MIKIAIIFLILITLKAQICNIYLSLSKGNASSNGSFDNPIDYLKFSKKMIKTFSNVSLILLTDNEISSENKEDFLYDFTNCI